MMDSSFILSCRIHVIVLTADFFFMYFGGPKSVVQCPKDMETHSTKKEI